MDLARRRTAAASPTAAAAASEKAFDLGARAADEVVDGLPAYSPAAGRPRGRRQRRAWAVAAAAAVAGVLAVGAVHRIAVGCGRGGDHGAGGAGLADFERSVHACRPLLAAAALNASDAAAAAASDPSAALGRQRRNPRAASGHGGLAAPRAVLIEGATLWDGDGVVHANTDVLLRAGVVHSVGRGLRSSLAAEDLAGATVVPANGRFVTPGLVDMHSHMGVDSWPAVRAHQDGNEGSTTRLTPQLRVIDAFNPWDNAIKIINSGGVTTSLVLPGSRNLMGGEAFAYKHRHVPSNRSEDMLLNAGMGRDDGKKWRWMKMACGENPKNHFGNERQDGPIYPTTRLGEGYLFREKFAAAANLRNQQNDWCERAVSAADKHGTAKAHKLIESRFPTDVSLESLVALLRGDIILNVHCYETYDIEAMVRHSHEFGFKIATFHHALEAWQVSDLLAKERIAVAIFDNLHFNKADYGHYKQEAYGISVRAAQALASKGVKVAFKSDHPVLNAQHLIHEAAKAHHYGLSGSLAIQSVTSVPADRIGQGHRLGRVAPGFDADVVIWDRNPLDIGAHPLKVFVDGFETFEHTSFASEIGKPFDPRLDTIKAEIDVEPAEWRCTIPGAGAAFTIENATNILATPESSPSQPGDRIVVENGIVTCLGTCEPKGTVVDAAGFWITPGLVAAGAHLGLEEIMQESVTSSGTIEVDPSKISEAPSAKDGLQIGRHLSKQLDAAFKAGVTTAVSLLRSTTVVGSDNVVFRTGGSDPVDDIVREERPTRNMGVGLESIGTKGAEMSFGGHIQIARKLLAADNPESLVIKVNDANNIRRLAPVLRDHDVLLGAAESWKHAGRLAGKSVVLQPARCTPATWSTRECIEPSRVPSGYDILRKGGVNVGVSVAEDNFVRDLIWEAGWAVANRHANLTDFEFAKESVSLVSWNLARAYGFESRTHIRVGGAANFVLYDGVPGTLGARVRAVVDGTITECNTQQA